MCISSIELRKAKTTTEHLEKNWLHISLAEKPDRSILVTSIVLSVIATGLEKSFLTLALAKLLLALLQKRYSFF